MTKMDTKQTMTAVRSIIRRQIKIYKTLSNGRYTAKIKNFIQWSDGEIMVRILLIDKFKHRGYTIECPAWNILKNNGAAFNKTMTHFALRCNSFDIYEEE